jgi:uncharacterized membrane protein YdjX (TVP38/TMEM64 family)
MNKTDRELQYNLCIGKKATAVVIRMLFRHYCFKNLKAIASRDILLKADNFKRKEGFFMLFLSYLIFSF